MGRIRLGWKIYGRRFHGSFWLGLKKPLWDEITWHDGRLREVWKTEDGGVYPIDEYKLVRVQVLEIPIK